MVAKKPRIVIIGAGMAGLAAANRLYTSTDSKDMFELCVVEGGPRIGGGINTSEFGGDRIEMGATWIHGIGGSPVHKIAQEIHSLESEQPWECMDGFLDEPKTIAAGGFELSPSLVQSISTLYKSLMDYAQGKLMKGKENSEEANFYRLAAKALKVCPSNGGGPGKLSVGSFLRQVLNAHWDSVKEQEQIEGCDNWSTKLLEEAIFAMHENGQRTCTSAGDLMNLDFGAESEYRMFPGIQWQREAHRSTENGCADRPVKIHFCDGSIMLADHVLLTVSLGVLKAGIGSDSGMFNPPLPTFKTEAISRLGFGAVNKMFLQLSSSHDGRVEDCSKFPFLQMAFHRQDSELRQKKIPERSSGA
ncbi:FLAVIN MONOAMINE OXIDASE [Salix purpurea]|uniref:FLAVIN MONOAMINE OXIDASE n=1 Tax=Salix purpurea TaxID=77065 RepID=A0A9Q0UK74_SALPP|nr:FLAVIN MONOAMINE OXIDASE [Salix purpurea]